MDFNGIENAVGLTYADSRTIKTLVDVLNQKAKNNTLQMRYLYDKQPVKNLGLAVPDKFTNVINTSVGIIHKAVDMYCERSQVDGITLDGELGERLNAVLSDNDFSLEYSRALPSMISQSCGWWTVGKGDPGEPEAIISYHDALTGSALWDYRKKRIKAGMVVADMAQNPNRGGQLEPSLVILHTSTHVVEIEKRESGQWAATYLPHALGRPMMEPMCFRADNSRPFGRSLITKSAQAIYDSYQRAVLRLELHAEAASQPMRYMLGADDAAFELDRLSLAYNAFLRVSKDEDGDIPTIGQLEATSPESHIRVIEHLMARMSAETSVPASAFGTTASGGVYVSSESLRASSNDLVLAVERMNHANGKAIKNVALMVLAVLLDKPLAELTEEERAVTVHWVDPSMPSAASVADATVKLAGAVPEFGGTEIFWEMNGFNEDQRKRVKADMAANQQRVIAASVFGA